MSIYSNYNVFPHFFIIHPAHFIALFSLLELFCQLDDYAFNIWFIQFVLFTSNAAFLFIVFVGPDFSFVLVQWGASQQTQFCAHPIESLPAN